jgi:peroxiredoxin Q/BCP
VAEFQVVEGEVAPDFTLASDSGEAITLSSLRGKPVVLYFYSRDDTRAQLKEPSAPQSL